MKLAVWLVPFFLAIVAAAQTHTTDTDPTYTVQGATPEREAVLRQQIQRMQPSVLPYRVRFVPHWQYVYAARNVPPPRARRDGKQNVHPPGEPERFH